MPAEDERRDNTFLGLEEKLSVAEPDLGKMAMSRTLSADSEPLGQAVSKSYRPNLASSLSA